MLTDLDAIEARQKKIMTNWDHPHMVGMVDFMEKEVPAMLARLRELESNVCPVCGYPEGY